MPEHLFMYIIFIISFITIFLISYSYYDLCKNIKNIIFLQKDLENYLDNRFKIFENIVFLLKDKINYEQTVLKEIIQLRSYAQVARDNNDIKIQFETEEKITKLSYMFFDIYPEVKTLPSYQSIHESCLLINKNIEIMKDKYNLAIDIYNKKKHSTLGSFTCSLFKSKTYFIFDYWGQFKNKK